MAQASQRSSKNTVLYVGTLRAEVGLFGTSADPSEQSRFESAGPNGGVLRAQTHAVAKPVPQDPDAPVMETPVSADPLAGEAERGADPGGGDAPARDGGSAVETAASLARSLMEDTTVEGDFARALVEEGSGELVEPDRVRRGVRRDDGSFVDCTELLGQIEERTKLDRIDVVACIDSTTVTRERVIGAHYLGATEPRDRPVLRLLFEALAKRREVAVAKYTVGRKQRLGVIVAHRRTGTLMMLQLVWAEDFREAPKRAVSIQEAGVTEPQVEKMVTLLGLLHGKPDVVEGLRDEAIAMREELKVRALAGELDDAVIEPLPTADGADDLEAMLAASLEAVEAGRL